MKGYKAFKYENGILRSKINIGKTGDIFEIGIPKQKVEIADDISFSENGYSFCGTIEEVASRMDILTPLRGRKDGGIDYRVFLIDTLDSQVIGTSSHYKAEQIVVEREITQNEIIQYYLDNPKLKPNIKENLWDEFCNNKIQPYKFLIDEKEINDLIIENCFRYLQDKLCNQISKNLCLEVCKECKGWKWKGDTHGRMTDYYYLIARLQLFNGVALNNIDEYHKLEDHENERKSLCLISDYLSKQSL